MSGCQELDIRLPSGVTLPSKCRDLHSPLVLVLGHGLGTNGLKNRDHNHDKWIQMCWETLSNAQVVGLVAYTTRGHGASRGWERYAEEYQQFTWENLAEDMIQIGEHLHLNQFLVGGQSMGSATALYATIKYPERVKGLILIRPPTAWHVRRARRGHLEEIANQSQERFPNEPNHNVFRGAAISDLPPMDSSLYSSITCPVLILCHEGDKAHPVETATTLSHLIPHAQLFISKTQEDALREFPQLLLSFIRSFSSPL